MIKEIIGADWHEHRKIFQKEGEDFLNVSEFYCDTIQGEGIHIGHPAAFLRLQGCTLNCAYCDTKEVWKHGSQYSFTELFELMEKENLISKFRKGQHLVITGGSPLIQQLKLKRFLTDFFFRYKVKPYIEIENECVIKPDSLLLLLIDCWNNSPKLESSGVSFDIRYIPDIIKAMSRLNNSWFKFVISSVEDWVEINEFYLRPALIRRDQIILMPEGFTEKEIKNHRNLVFELATANMVKYCSREHIILFNKKIGV